MMNRTYFQIQQHTGYQFEPLQEGNYDTLPEAQAAMAELEAELHFRDMRICEYLETDIEHKQVRVVESGTESETIEDVDG